MALPCSLAFPFLMGVGPPMCSESPVVVHVGGGSLTTIDSTPDGHGAVVGDASGTGCVYACVCLPAVDVSGACSGAMTWVDFEEERGTWSTQCWRSHSAVGCIRVAKPVRVVVDAGATHVC